MNADPFVDPDIVIRIENELALVERDFGVRILLAVESGSRAWRFPSRDSDHDVRFIYLETIENYLTVMPRRDVIERPVDALFDVNGWDLRKALRLLVGSNAVLLEWLTSPQRYRAVGDGAARMLDLARATMDLTALAYHYDRQARRVFGDIIASDGEIRLKSYFYALRSVFALRWVRERRETPPMDLPRLMSGLSISAEIREIIADLVIRKRNMVESDTITRIPLLDAMIREALADKIEKMVSDERSSAGRQADALFASIVREFA